MTTTPNKGYTLPTVGGDTNAWGGELNNNFTNIDLSLGGTLSVSMAGVDVTLSNSQAENLAFLITGTLSANVNLIFPSVGGFYIVNNQTTGSFTITLTTGSGATVTAAQGARTAIYCDGTNIYAIGVTSTTGVASPHGRLTLTSLTPVLTSTVSTAGTVYYTPYVGNAMPLWNGSSFVSTSVSEISNVLANAGTGNAGPAAAIASSVYDLYVWSNGGTPTLTRSPAWSSTTSRGSGAGTAQQSSSNGIIVNAQNITNGPAAGFGTYVGTIATDASGGTVTFNRGSSAAGGGQAWIGLWNTYNRVIATAFVQDSNTSHTYSSSTIRPYDNSTTARISLVRGAEFDAMTVIQTANIQWSSATNVGSSEIGIGLDSTSANSSLCTIGTSSINGNNGEVKQFMSRLDGYPGLGFHFFQALESGDGFNAVTYLSNNFGSGTANRGCWSLTANFTW